MVFTVGAILMEKMAGLLERSLVAGMLNNNYFIFYIEYGVNFPV